MGVLARTGVLGLGREVSAGAEVLTTSTGPSLLWGTEDRQCRASGGTGWGTLCFGVRTPGSSWRRDWSDGL